MIALEPANPTARDVGLVADGEVAVVQDVALTTAIVGELLDRSFDQTQAAVVAVQADVVDQFLERVEAALIILAGNQFHLVPLVERHLGRKVAHDRRQRLAVVTVGRIADQTGAGVRALADDQHGSLQLPVASCRFFMAVFMTVW